MRKPSLPAVARMAAYGVVVILLGATLAVQRISIRTSVDIRARLQSLGTRLDLLSQQDDSRMDDLSKRLADLSRMTQRDITSVGRTTRTDMSRMRDTLTDRLDEVAQQVGDLAALPRQEAADPSADSPPAPPVASASESKADPQALAQVPSPTPALAASSPAEEDLSAARQAKEGAALFDSGRYDLAQKAFSQILANRPEDSNARLYYAASLYRANPADATRYTQIERNLLTVLRSDSDNVLALETISMLEVEARKWPDALGHLRQLVALQPGNARFQKTAGFCAFKVGDLAAAHGYYESSARLSPVDPEALTSLGDCESALGNAVDAETSWKSALSTLDSGSPTGARASLELCVKLARSAYGRGAFDESLRYSRTRSSMGTSMLLRAYEGLSLAAMGNVREANAILTEIASSSDARAATLARKGLEEASR